MIYQPYSKLIAIKQWADRGLYDVASQNFDRLTSEDASIMLRVLDHMHVVDRIFQHHLQGLSHTFQAPRSESVPELQALESSARKVDDWYASYVDTWSVWHWPGVCGVGIVFASASMLPQIIPAFGQRPLGGKRERSADHKGREAL
jgi:hypothetical protein